MVDTKPPRPAAGAAARPGVGGIAGDDEASVGRPPGAVESILRALSLLECFEPGKPELSLSEMVHRGGYTKTTTYRLLKTLEYAGWLERSATNGFRLTIKPFQIGTILIDSLDLYAEAQQFLHDLAYRFNESVFLFIPREASAVCLARIDGGSVRVMDVDVGGSIPLNLGAASRAMLAFNEEELLPKLLARGLTGRTKESFVDAAKLRRDLAEARKRGYTVSHEDVTPHVAAIGAPVFGMDKQVVAALSIGGLAEGFTPPREREIATAVMEAAFLLSRRLGWGPKDD